MLTKKIRQVAKLLVMKQAAQLQQFKETQVVFISKKNSNRKRSRSDMLFDRLNYSMNSFYGGTKPSWQ